MLITKFSDLDPDGRYTYADYLKWQFDEMVELIKGKIFKMSPSPSRYHQDIAINITTFFRNELKGKICKVYTAPSDVRLISKGNGDKDITTVVQPDVFVVCDPSKLDEKGCLGSPDLIVEIVSPFTAEKDISRKFELYQESGVLEYWLVFPNDKIVEIFVLDGGRFGPPKVFTELDLIPIHIFEGMRISGIDVFEQ